MNCGHLHSAFGPGCPHCMRPVSPCCRKPLEGGPVIFRCTGCGHDVHGSVIDREYISPMNGAAGRAPQVTHPVGASRRVSTQKEVLS